MKLKTSYLTSGFKDQIFEIHADHLADRGTVFSNKSIKCKLTSVLIKNKIIITGEVKASPSYECIRCLEINPKSITVPINLTVAFSKKAYIDEHSKDIIYLKNENDFIDLNIILADLIELAEPMKPLCNQDCKGLCQMCGVNKKFSCQCKFQDNTTNWEALKSLQN